MNMRTKLVTWIMLLSCEFIMISQDFIISNMTASDHSITVFVHGTYPARKLLEYSLGKFLIYCPFGLSLAKDLPSNYHFHKMARGCVELNPQLYCLDQFYIFGWESEHIHDKVRSQAAACLVTQLEYVVANYYKQHRVVPKIRLLGFSHGGNVVLHTANYFPITIDGYSVEVEVWIFGTPIQSSSRTLVNSSNFTRVYSFYSIKDWLQRMDPQGLRTNPINIKKLWSDRMFDITDRCVQVEFTVNGKPISHVYYRSIFKYFPLIQELTEQKSQGLTSGFIAVDLIV